MSKKKCPNFTKFSVSVAVAGSFFGEVTIRYVLPVFSTSCQTVITQRDRLSIGRTVMCVTRQGRQVQWGGAESAVYGCCAVRRCGVRGGWQAITGGGRVARRLAGARPRLGVQASSLELDARGRRSDVKRHQTFQTETKTETEPFRPRPRPRPRPNFGFKAGILGPDL